MTVQEAYTQLSAALQSIYEPREAATIAGMAIEHITGFAGSLRLLHKHEPFTTEQVQTYRKIMADLLLHKPVQYVLQEAYFMGLKLYVNEEVLIPRPETEELVEWMVSDIKKSTMKNSSAMAMLSIIDIGTGSGCIPIALKSELPGAQLYAVDISAHTLDVARKNADGLNTDIHFFMADILDATIMGRHTCCATIS